MQKLRPETTPASVLLIRLKGVRPDGGNPIPEQCVAAVPETAGRTQLAFTEDNSTTGGHVSRPPLKTTLHQEQIPVMNASNVGTSKSNLRLLPTHQLERDLLATATARAATTNIQILTRTVDALRISWRENLTETEYRAMCSIATRIFAADAS